MFAKQIVDSDAFLDMPLSAQALYFHLAMRADDDGFINNPKKIQRMIGGSDDDLRLLILKRFILTFESGVIVIKHWRIHNYIRSDRHKETLYRDEMSELVVDERNAYTEKDRLCLPSDIPSDYQVTYQRDAQDRLGKVSIDKNNNILSEKKANQADEIKEIVAYLNEKAGTKYRASSESTARHIRARLNEGYSVEDFKTVIDKKRAEWSGTEMSKYLRPETLFGSKFESYLNQKSGARRGANGVVLDEPKEDDLDGIL